MSIGLTTDRSTLLLEARQEWVKQQETRVQTGGTPSNAILIPPPDAQLIGQDALLQAELASLTSSSTVSATVNILA